jgi:hypothetical protein
VKSFANAGWRTVDSGKLYAGGAWRTITRAMVFIGGAWKTAMTFAGPVSVAAPPVLQQYYLPGSGPGIASAGITATPSGGIAPYSYGWVVTGYGTPVVPTLTGDTTANVGITAGAYAGDTGTVFLNVTVTDAIGQTAAASTYVTFANILSGHP